MDSIKGCVQCELSPMNHKIESLSQGLLQAITSTENQLKSYIILQAKTVHGKTTYEWHTDDIRVNTSDIRMTYKYIRVTYGWHWSEIRMTYEYIRVAYGWHRSEIRMTYEYIRVTYRWHKSTYEWHTNGIRVHLDKIWAHTNDMQMTCEWRINCIKDLELLNINFQNYLW